MLGLLQHPRLTSVTVAMSSNRLISLSSPSSTSKERQNYIMGFRNGSTHLMPLANLKTINQIWEKMLSHYLVTHLHLLQQHTAAPFSSFANNPIQPAQSAILLLCSSATHHVISTLPDTNGGLYFFKA